MEKITVKMSGELKGQIESLMNAITLKYSENEIQRQLGMLYYVYMQEIDDNKSDFGEL